MLRKRVEQMKLMKWFPLAIFLPYIANTGGWITTEMGRQPWIVQGLLQHPGWHVTEPVTTA